MTQKSFIFIWITKITVVLFSKPPQALPSRLWTRNVPICRWGARYPTVPYLHRPIQSISRPTAWNWDRLAVVTSFIPHRAHPCQARYDEERIRKVHTYLLFNFRFGNSSNTAGRCSLSSDSARPGTSARNTLSGSRGRVQCAIRVSPSTDIR